MEYISVEEFLNQPYEVEKVLQDWFIEKFKTSNEFDIFNYNGEDLCYKNILDRNCNFDVEDCIPLLTEGQLRQFIEDKTECKLIVNLGCVGYQIVLMEFFNNDRDYDVHDDYEVLITYNEEISYD